MRHPLLCTLALLCPGSVENVGAQTVVDSGRHHLGTPGKPEWRAFAGSRPEGRSLSLTFPARANPGESTLLIRQRDVKLTWDVRLNDQRIGTLHPMEDALVHALAVPAGTLRDGENRLTLGPPPGDDDIVIEEILLDDRPVRQAVGRAELKVRVADSDSSTPLPARITIVDRHGALAPLVVAADSHLAARPGVVYTPDGLATLRMPPGRYTVTASRGFEYGADTREVTLTEEIPQQLSLAIRREVETNNLIACDTHVHTFTYSGHGDATLDERAVTLAGEGIELPVATDHNHFTADLAVAARRMGVASWFTPVVGDEVTTRTGHFNAFPFPDGATPPDASLADWPALLLAIRQAPGERVVVLNHPRDVHAGYRPFGVDQFNPVTGEHQRGPLGVDAMEVINSAAMLNDPMQTVRDWMALRNRGERLTAVGSSDSHDVARFIVGQGRTYIACDDDSNPANLDVDAACRALKSGRAVVSLGLLARMTVDDRFTVGDLATGLGDTVRVEATVSHPSWSSVDRVQLFANGVAIREESIPAASAAKTHRVAWTLPRPAGDVSLVVVASGPGVTAPFWALARPYQSTSIDWTPRVFGITNPIDLDGDGDGVWTSPLAYAQAAIAKAGTAPEALFAALHDADESTAAQAAGLAHKAGRDVRNEEFQQAMARATEPVRKGFAAFAATLPAAVDVEGQPLGANADRVMRALETLGAPLPAASQEALAVAIRDRDSDAIQQALDPLTLLAVEINPEERVKVLRGGAKAQIQQGGYTPVLVKVRNEPGASRRLRITSPQSGLIVGGVAPLSMQRQDQRGLTRDEVPGGDPGRFLQVEMATSPPLTETLSGLEVEYAVALIYSAESGRREATIGFEIGAGTQDLGSRGEVPILFDVRPAVPVLMRVRDVDGTPTAAHFEFRDRAGRIHPAQPKRVAPDLFFQSQIYRHDGGTVLLPPGPMTMTFGRGPEYLRETREVEIPAVGEAQIEVKLQRWFDPASFGFFGGDHHIHAAGCAHYTSPTQGIRPEDVFLQVKGEGLNVGCVLTWGPCYDFQRNFFAATPHPLSDARTVLKYDVEVSGFGSQALGHVCLLNLRDQTYPGSDGTSTQGWPSWTTPVLRWAKGQGGVTGYAHSASGLEIHPPSAANRLMAQNDANGDGILGREETAAALLPGSFEAIDADRDGTLSRAEVEAGHDRAAAMLPNLAIPEMDGVGAMEIPVAVAEGVCDFISAMDTPRIAEWNMWYHLLNCGFPLKVSGETDFPCMSGSRVGQGRVYVHLGDVPAVDFAAWCEGLRLGHSYVSDGFAHVPTFSVGGKTPGERLDLDEPQTVAVHARVAFSAQTPRTVAQGGIVPAAGLKVVGDTVNLHGPAPDGQVLPPGSTRRVELIVNGEVAASRDVPADGATHDLEFSVPVTRSSWVALRQFPQMHTNPVEVRVQGHPIRASRRSAVWSLGVINQLWSKRAGQIKPEERDAARQAFDRARELYRKIAAEAPEGS